MKKSLVKKLLSVMLSGVLMFFGLIVVSCIDHPKVEDPILGEIKNVTMQKLTSQMVEFTWDIPMPTRPSERIEYDYVSIQLKKGDAEIDWVQINNYDEQKVVFKKLEPETDYKVIFTSSSYESGSVENPIEKTFTTLAIADDPSYLPDFDVSVKEGVLSGSGTDDDPYIVHAGGDQILFDVVGVAPDGTLQVYIYNNELSYDENTYKLTVPSSFYLDSFICNFTYIDSDGGYNKYLYFTCTHDFAEVRLSVDASFIDINTTDSMTLKKAYNDENGNQVYNPYITDESWTSSDETIATVEKGVVTFVSEGKVIITYTASGINASIELGGYKNLQFPTSAGFGVEMEELYVGESFDPEFTMTPDTATPLYVISVSDDTVVSVDEDKKITALKPGTAIVTLTYQISATDTETDSITVTVHEKPTAFSIGESKVKLSISDTNSYTIPVTLTPATAKAHKITYTSDSSIVSVNEKGLVFIRRWGSESKVDAKITVVVNDLPAQELDVCYYVPLTGVYFDDSYLMMRPNDDVELVVKYEPFNAYVEDLTPVVKHSSEGILEIANGKITAKKAGLDSIRYELGDFVAVLPVIVEKNAKIYDSPVTKTITQGNTDDNQKIAWKYSKELAKYGVLKNYYTGKIDIQANNNGWQQSTANNAGWVWGLNGDILNLENNGGYFTYNGKGTYANDGIELYVTPIIVYRDEIPYVMLVSTLWNDSDKEITNVDLSMGTDVYIHSGTNSPLTRTSYGAVLMCGNGCGFQYVADLNAYTPVDTVWFGNGPDDVTQHLYDDSGYSKNVQYKSTDTAMAFSWQNITLGDDPEVFAVMIGALKDVGGTLEAIIY